MAKVFPRRYRKKPVVIRAVRLDGSAAVAVDAANWANVRDGAVAMVVEVDGGYGLRVQTLEGTMVAGAGDWLIEGVVGEFYPCKPDVFAATYEPVGGDA